MLRIDAAEKVPAISCFEYFWIMSWKGMWLWRMRTLQFREGRIGRIPCRTLDCSSSLSADSAELQDLHFRILHCTFHSTLRLCCFWLVAWPARHTCSFTFRDHAVGCASLLSEIGRTPPAWARAFTVSTQQEVLWSSISVSLFCDILESLVTSCEISWSYWGRILHVFNHVFKFSMMTLIDVLWYVQRLQSSLTFLENSKIID